ncbi:MAG: hypothetical protein E7813_09145 [Bradyrhizobium sp.]|uniref:hypothetical protein n=1 Tax=Bradyrhizobium sp. TaxID=376 RepID=UPI001204B77A|nr:hypothetical protein [Bradyrhizobium sp.]THD70160.1 MAG: hypothetical protein E7813_09145 [Bradyrhizobium sp.]
MESSVGIYQPFYKSSLIKRLDPGFIPLDWLSNPTPALRELALHHHIAQNKLFARHRLTGLFSPKFFSKTGLHSQRDYDWIAESPGHDIYLISGGCHVPYLHYNGVVRNQILHSPEFEERMSDLCGKIGFELPEEFPRQTNANRSGCSYWVASATFWENWIADVVAPIFALIGKSSETDEIFAYAKHAAPAPVYILTFIYERLIDYYIERNRIDAIYYPWDAQSILSLDYDPSVRAYLEVMIPLVDRIDASRQWSDRDKAWLRERYAALTLTGIGLEMVTADSADYDLPRRYPNEVP